MQLRAPAKINLYLKVVGRRDDGYHLLNSLMCCVGLYDTLDIRLPVKESIIACNHPKVPADKTNLALKAVYVFNEALARRSGHEPCNVAIKLTKTIPVGAGLGGGSSDAATVLVGLNQYHGGVFTRAQLNELALQLGADVPFFIDQKPALVAGIGEQLSRCRGVPPLGVVLIYPGFGVSTAEVFKNLNFGLTKCEKKIRYFPFINGKFDLNNGLDNDLEIVVARQFPVIRQMKDALLEQGARGASMTGSGSAVFGLFSDQAEAQSVLKRLNRQSGWQVFATGLITES